jgi:hypothetical protein
VATAAVGQKIVHEVVAPNPVAPALRRAVRQMRVIVAQVLGPLRVGAQLPRIEGSAPFNWGVYPQTLRMA